MKYSIVVPLYNEELSLKILVEKLARVFAKDWQETELIFVNDGSTDSSLKILQNLQKKYANLQIVSFRVNQGKSECLNAGFKAAQGDIVVTLDADLQDEPKEIPKLLKKLSGGFDMVSSWKRHRKDPQNRLVLTRIFNNTVRFLTKVDLHDFNSGLKAYRREVIKEISVYGELHRFIPVLAVQHGFKVAEVPVVHNERLYGTSKYNWTRVPQGFFDLFTVLFLNKFKRSPMYFFGAVGSVLLILGFLFLVYLSALHFAGIAIGDRPLLIFGVLFVVSGLQFFFTGFLAELIVHYLSGKNGRNQSN
jgi:glycosyltransferase involved in cell wall biosynthesis